ADLAKVSQDEAERLLDLRSASARLRPAPGRTSAPAATTLEWTLLRYLLLRPQRAPDVDQSLLDSGLPESSAITAITEWWREAAPAGGSGHALLIEKFSGSPYAEVLFEAQQSLLDLALNEDDADAEIANCLLALRVKRTGEGLDALRGRVARGEAGPQELAQRLKEYDQLKRDRIAGQSGL